MSVTSVKRRTLYAKTPNIDGANVSGLCFAVWSALCSYAKWDVQNGVFVSSVPGSCVPRLSLLSVRSHCSVDTVRRCIKELEAAGYVRVSSRYSPPSARAKTETKGQQRSNSYILYPAGNAPALPAVPLTEEEKEIRRRQAEEVIARIKAANV